MFFYTSSLIFTRQTSTFIERELVMHADILQPLLSLPKAGFANDKTLTICVFIAWQISNGNMKIKSNWISLVKTLIVVKMIGHHDFMSQVRSGRFMQHYHDAAECWWRENAIFCQRMPRIVDRNIFALQLDSSDKIYFLNRIMCSDFQWSWNHCKICFTNMSS